MARGDDVMLTAEELRLRQKKRKRLLVTGIILAALVGAAVLGGRPVLHAIKAWQARRHAQTALALMEKEQWNDARKEATAAFQLWPNEPQAVRAVARFLSRTRQAQALEFWDRLEKQGRLTREDLVDEATIALSRATIPGQSGPLLRSLAARRARRNRSITYSRRN